MKYEACPKCGKAMTRIWPRKGPPRVACFNCGGVARQLTSSEAQEAEDELDAMIRKAFK